MTAKPDQDYQPRGEDFVSRWSRRKQQAREEEAKPVEPVAKAPGAAEPPPLPPVDSLTPASDYSAFMQPKVDESLKRAAMKKLFSDPHFNIMDGLDIYIDDYSISEPIPPEMLKELKQAQNILAWAKEDREKEAERERQQAIAEGREPPPALTESADDSAEVPTISEMDTDAATVPIATVNATHKEES
jgi:hypothetical protein